MIATPGRSADLNGPAAQPYAPLATTAFEGMTPKVLVVVGTKDSHPRNLLRSAGLGSDAYTASPAPKTRLDNFDDAEHGLSGIPAFAAAEATVENPDRVTAARALVRAHLRARVVPAGTGLIPGCRGLRISSHCSRSRFVKPSGGTSCPGALSSRKPMMRPDVSTA
ncbi:hypothetical protein [Streptomyces venezuelae]|uniref:hypothetical protein n=1 Tax=Streptomyces venezuelae TaxID=54571 RepID=UPI0016834A49|nr:hypothetical protein [Streptomyces venezuelae]